MSASPRRTRRPSVPVEPAAELPVAQVCVESGLSHLDRPFDYLVPATMAATAVPGSRVRVRFAGRLRDGFVLARVAHTEHRSRLAPLERSVSAEPVLAPEIARLARVIADRHAGTLADVLRLAIPPRHATAEARQSVEVAGGVSGSAAFPGRSARGWSRYRNGDAFLAALAGRRAARAVWAALPGPEWPDLVAGAVAATLAAGRGAVVVVPDSRDLARVDAALTETLGAGRHVALSAGLGPAERYRRWLAVRRGAVRAVVGTRAAAFAPVADPGLMVLWDDGDDSHAEPRAPYCHARDVLTTRAALAGTALLLGGFARTAEGQLLVETGWAQPLAASRDTVRAVAPRVAATGDDVQLARDPGARSARLPSLAWQVARAALAADAPVLVQVPRAGYQPSLACDRCRYRALCPACSGPLARQGSGESAPVCRWCGQVAEQWECPHCGAQRTRALVIGAHRTREELGRAFPGVPVLTSAGSEVLAGVPDRPAIVVCTPGAEPVAEDGYGAALLLDGWALLARPDLRAGEEAVRRWFAAAALVRPVGRGGQVVIGADAALAAVQALVRWDPAGHAERELAERRELGFPPATRIASLTAAESVLTGLLDGDWPPPGADLLGPVPVDDERSRLLVRVPQTDSVALTSALGALARTRSAHKESASVRIEVDPLALW